VAEEGISATVAPSIDLEQALFHVFGHAATRIEAELVEKRYWRWRMVRWVLDRMTSDRVRQRLVQRFLENTRTSEAFLANNHYLMIRLRLSNDGHS
jgi:lipoprotein NlpI